MNRKEIAIKLIENQLKINAFHEKLEGLDIRIELPICDLAGFALDVIGIPKDNTVETMINNVPAENTFCRDWFYDVLYDSNLSAKEFVDMVWKERKNVCS